MKRHHPIAFIISLFIVGLLYFPALADAQDYYVDAVNGSDNWTGTAQECAGCNPNTVGLVGPWRTLGKVSSFSATVDFVPGTRILFKRGDRFVTNGVPIYKGGAEGSPVTFSAYGTGPQPVLQMSGPAITTWVNQGNGIWLYSYTGTAVAGLWEEGVYLKHASDETLQNGQFFWKPGTGIYYRPADNNPANHTTFYRGAANGFAIENLSYLTFSDLHFEIGSSAIGGGGKTQPIHHLVVENCTFENLIGPISLYVDNGYENHDITIRNNTFRASGQALGVKAAQNGVEQNRSFLVKGNQVIDIDANGNYKAFATAINSGQDIGEGMGFQNLNDSIIAGNEISVGVRAAAISLWTNPSSFSHNNRIEHNYVHDIIGVGMTMFSSATVNTHLGNVMRYNRISNCSVEDLSSGGGIRLSGMDAPGSNLVHNNTIHGCGTSIYMSALSEGFHVFNNISLSPLHRHVSHSGNVVQGVDRNLYFPDMATGFKFGATSGDFVWWRRATGQDQTSLVSDPLVMNAETDDVHLTPNSPAIDMGETHNATADFDGNPISARPDIGAYEIGDLADLGVTMSVGPDPVLQGSPLTYTITVTNNGSINATGVMLDDTLPGSVNVTGYSASQGSCGGSPIFTCNLGTIAAGGSAQITINVVPNVAGTITNTATVSAGTRIIDRNSSNNTATADTAVVASGLTGAYFDNKDFTNLKLTRVDPTVNFNWGNGSPDSSVGANTFSVRWTGFVQIPASGTYRFYTQTDDGVRLWVNNVLLVNDWNNHSVRERSGTITLTAGQIVSVKMEYYENTGAAVARLLWSGPDIAKQIIPQGSLWAQ